MAPCRSPCPACSKECETDHEVSGLNYHLHSYQFLSLRSTRKEDVTVTHKWTNHATGGL